MLTSSDRTILQYGNMEEIQMESDSYVSEILLKYIPPNLLTTPVYINLTLLPCPEGFHLINSRCTCILPFIANNMICNFTNGKGYIYRNDTTWIGTLSKDRVFIQQKCPFDYCISELIGVDLSYPDSQWGVFIQRNGTMEWNGGMERWNGMEWNSGMTTPTESVS